MVSGRALAALLLALLLACSCLQRGAAADDAAPDQSAPRPSAPAEASARSVRIHRVIDGDTFELEGGERVRILGIDTAERHHHDARVKALAAEATRLTKSLATSGPVVLTSPTAPQRDKFGRTLAYVELPGAAAEADLGARLIASGLARAYPSDHPRAPAYRTLQAKARQAAVGMWAPEIRAILEAAPALTVAHDKARAHVGALARVTGPVTSIRRSDKVLLVTLGEGAGAFTGAVFPHRFFAFPESVVSEWQGKTVALAGRIKLYHDRPEIILDDPEQVEILSVDHVP